MIGWIGTRSDTVYPLDAADLGLNDAGDVRPSVLRKNHVATVTEKDRLWSGLLAGFANNVSVVGIKYFVDANAYVLRRLLWLSLVLIGVGLLFFQITDRVTYYLSYPTTVKTKLRYVSSLPFPTITICNENMIKLSEAAKLGIVDDVKYIYMDEYRHEPSNVTLNGSISNWTDVLSDLAPQTEETIQRCKLAGRACDQDAWTRRITDLGYCFSFNTGDQNYSVVTEGIRSGLEVLLFANQYEYLGMTSPSAGFRVLLHDREEVTFMYDKAMKAPVDNLVLLSITMRKIRDLGPPYGDCVDIPGYREYNCKFDCFKKNLYNICGCIQHDMEGNETKCDLYQYHNCVKKVRDAYYRSGGNLTDAKGKSCDCPRECCKTQYQILVTHSTVSNFFFDTLADMYNAPLSDFKDNFTLINFYVDDMYYEDVSTEAAYPITALMSDIGGAFGFVLGSTVLTVVEFFDFFVRTVTAICAQQLSKRNKFPHPTMVRPATAAHR